MLIKQLELKSIFLRMIWFTGTFKTFVNKLFLKSEKKKKILISGGNETGRCEIREKGINVWNQDLNEEISSTSTPGKEDYKQI